MNTNGTINNNSGSDDIEWIKDLIRSELKMEEAGIVDFSPAINTDNIILSETLSFLKNLKREFIKNASIFNQLKGSNNGQIKVYGIAKTHADFMLFRNGYKLVFNMVNPGKVQITFHNMATPFTNTKNARPENPHVPSATIIAAWGAFNEIRWFADKKSVNIDHLVKFYTRLFVQNSAN